MKLPLVGALLIALSASPAFAQTSFCQPIEAARSYVASVGGEVVSESQRVPFTADARYMYWTSNGALFVTIIYDDNCVNTTATLVGKYVPETNA